jgi:hypothetical protein
MLLPRWGDDGATLRDLAFIARPPTGPSTTVPTVSGRSGARPIARIDSPDGGGNASTNVSGRAQGCGGRAVLEHLPVGEGGNRVGRESADAPAWKQAGMSRLTWYARQAETKAKACVRSELPRSRVEFWPLRPDRAAEGPEAPAGGRFPSNDVENRPRRQREGPKPRTPPAGASPPRESRQGVARRRRDLFLRHPIVECDRASDHHDLLDFCWIAGSTSAAINAVVKDRLGNSMGTLGSARCKACKYIAPTSTRVCVVSTNTALRPRSLSKISRRAWSRIVSLLLWVNSAKRSRNRGRSGSSCQAGIEQVPRRLVGGASSAGRPPPIVMRTCPAPAGLFFATP